MVIAKCITKITFIENIEKYRNYYRICTFSVKSCVNKFFNELLYVMILHLINWIELDIEFTV